MDPAGQQQQQQQAAAEPEAFSQFPAPPAFYKLYAASADAGPPPPLPVQGEIHALGEFFDLVSSAGVLGRRFVGHTDSMPSPTHLPCCPYTPQQHTSYRIQNAPFVPALDVPQMYTVRPDSTVGA